MDLFIHLNYVLWGIIIKNPYRLEHCYFRSCNNLINKYQITMKSNLLRNFRNAIFCTMIFLCLFAAGLNAQEKALPQIGYIDQIMAASHEFSGTKLNELKVVSPRWLKHDLHSRVRHELSNNWSFIQVKDNVAGEPATVQIPHQFSMTSGEAAWYIQNIEMDKPGKGERYFLMIEQVRMLCVVFVNGKEYTRHLGGYTPFEADITNALIKGKNTVALYVHNTTISWDFESKTLINQVGVYGTPSEEGLRSGSWLNGGIGREICLEKRREVFVRETAIVTSVENKEISVEITVDNNSGKPFSGMAKAEVLSWPDGKKLMDLAPFSFSVASGGSKTQVKIASWNNPPLWSPENPNLCVLRVTLPGKTPDVYEERFGFREFVIKGKQFYLNGIPTKLRGPSQFTPGTSYQGRERTFEFSKRVFLCEKKVLDFNAYRTHAIIFPRVVFEAADEAGVMMINQSSIWSSMKRYYESGGEEFMKNTRVEFAEWIKRDRNSPSVVIWDVENEMVRMGGELSFWNQLDGFVLEHDKSRIITHSGSGDDPTDRFTVNHAHMGEAYTNQLKKWKEQSNAPYIFGEFWLGSPGEHRLTSSKEVSSFDEYILEYARLFNEKALEMRYYDAPGVMHFAVQRERLYYRNSITDLASPDAVCEEVIGTGKNVEMMRHGAAALTSFFWPRNESATSKGLHSSTVIVCNDSETPKELKLTLKHEGRNVTPAGFEKPFLLNPGERRNCDVSIPAMQNSTVLLAELTSGGKMVSRDELNLRGLSANLSAPSLKRNVYFFGSETDARIISSLGLKLNTSDRLPSAEGSLVILGSNYEANDIFSVESVRSYLEAGGMLLSLRQERLPDWSPVQLGLWSSSRGAFAIYAPIYAQGHKVFSGISGEDLRWWDGESGKLLEEAFVRPGAVKKNSQGAWRALAGASRFENMSIVEMRQGKGTLLLSQLEILENLNLTEPRQVLYNMLAYLDEGGWKADGSMKLVGSLNQAFLEEELGVKANAFASPEAKNGNLMLAGQGADIKEIMDWANEGGRVVVFSNEMVSQVPGYTLSSDNNYRIAVRESDHPLLWGISSVNFSESASPLVTTAFTEWPDDAKVLFQSLKAENPSRSAQMTLSIYGVNMSPVVNGGPVIISRKTGKGEILLIPFDINENSPFCRELLSTLIANSGAEIETEDILKLEALVKRTNPPVIDGKLDDWTEDMEDRNIAQYIHAEPVVLSSKLVFGKKPENDMEFSGIVYFMFDNQNLYLAGAVFGGQKNQQLNLKIGSNTILVNLEGQTAIAINGKANPAVKFASGRIGSMSEYNDSGLLSFTQINRRFGMLERVNNVPNTTFETALPWNMLNLSPEREEIDLKIRLSSDGYTLELPAEGNTGKLIIDNKLGKTR